MLHTRLVTAALVAVAPLLSACGGTEPTIALLVADSSSRAVDVEWFVDRVESTCDECRVTVYDAEGDAGTQKGQARQAEAASVDAVVVVPVDPDDLATLTGSDVPVVSLGALAPGSERFVGLDSGVPAERSGTDLAAARDLVLGEREQMTYVPTRAMTERAADAAVAFLADAPVADAEIVDGVETWLFTEQDITLDTLTTVLVGQGILTLDDLCSGETEKRCAELGLR